MKRTPISTYRMQRRGGTGRTGMKTRDEDFVEHLFIASTHAYILIFTNKGRVYWLKVYEIPDVSAAGKGKHIGNLVGLQPGETVRTMLAVRNLEEENKYVFFATRNGLVKKSELREFMHVRSNGINAINIEDGDELVAARITNGNQIVFIASHEGMAIRFDENHVRPMGRAAYGVNGINLEERDYVVGMTVTPNRTSRSSDRRTMRTHSSASEKGKRAEVEPKSAHRNRRPNPKRHPDPLRNRKRIRQAHPRRRIPPDQPRRQRRNQHQNHGASRQSSSHSAGRRKFQVMLISQYGKIIRMDSKTIRESGRNAQGVRLLNMEPGDRVAAAVVLAPEEEPNGNGGTLLQ